MRFSLFASFRDLLASQAKVTQVYVFPLGALYLSLHSGGDVVAKNPYLGALCHQHMAKEKCELALVGVIVVKELREKQAWCEWDVAHGNRKSTETPGVLGLPINFTGKRGADIDYRAERPQGLGGVLDGGQGIIGGGVVVAFGIEFFSTHISSRPLRRFLGKVADPRYVADIGENAIFVFWG